MSELAVDVVEGEGDVELTEDVVEGGGLEAQVHTEVRRVVIVLRWQVLDIIDISKRSVDYSI